jgi:hypothetical protein
MAALVSVGPAILGAQSPAPAPACLGVSSAPLAMARGYNVNPLAAFAHEGAVTVLGWPAFRVARDGVGATRGTYRAVDSLFAGVVVRGDEAPRTIPLPIPGRGFEEPYVLGVEGGTARILFVVPRPLRAGAQRPDSLEIWSGDLDGTRWSGLEHRMTFGGGTLLGTQVVTGAALDSGQVTFAFGEFVAQGEPGITELTRRGGRWTRSTDATRMRSVIYLDAARIGDRWYRAMVGISRTAESEPPGSARGRLYLSTLDERGWSRPQLVATGTDASLGEPRLLRAPGGLRVAWLEFTERGRVLRWRDLGASAEAATGAATGSRPVVGRLTPGQGPWRDVLAFAVSPDTGVLATPAVGGWVERGRLPISLGLPPLVFSGPEGPLALVLAPAADDPEVEIIQVFDLRCALGGPRRE